MHKNRRTLQHHRTMAYPTNFGDNMKIGDLVRMAHQSQTYIGIIIEVRSYDETTYLIQFTDGDTSWFTGDWLEMIR